MAYAVLVCIAVSVLVMVATSVLVDVWVLVKVVMSVAVMVRVVRHGPGVEQVVLPVDDDVGATHV